MKWISVDERLPEANSCAVIVKVLGSNCPALAVLTDDMERGVWKVQPLFGAWYTTGGYVTHWATIAELPQPTELPQRSRGNPRSVTYRG